MAINKVVYGRNVLIDLTADTVTADKLAQGITAHDKSGAAITARTRSTPTRRTRRRRWRRCSQERRSTRAGAN